MVVNSNSIVKKLDQGGAITSIEAHSPNVNTVCKQNIAIGT